MSDWPFYLTTDISALSLGLLLASSIGLLVSLRVNARCQKLSKALFHLQNEFRAMNSGHLGMGREILKVSKEIARVESICEHTGSQGVSDKIYAQAGLLLSRGATIDEVVESCEIAPAEAELLAIMQHSAPSHQNRNGQSLVA